MGTARLTDPGSWMLPSKGICIQAVLHGCMDEAYQPVKLPRELIDAVDGFVSRKHLGYRSRAEFVADGVRRLLAEAQRGDAFRSAAEAAG